MSESENSSNVQTREIPGMFQGPVTPLVIKIALPMLMGMLVQLVYNMTDTFFISRIDLEDPSIVGGTGLIFPLIFFAIAMANGLMVGTSSLVARAVGAKDGETLSRSADSGIFLAVLAGLILFIPMYFFAEPLVRALAVADKTMGMTEDYFANGYAYLRVIVIIMIPMMVGNALSGILQGEGLMKYVMVSMMIGTLGNIILDPVFIFPKGEFLIGYFGLGVRGAAWATVVAQSFAVIYMIFVFIKNKSSVAISWKPSLIRGKVMLEILRVGIPQTMNQVMLSISFIAVNSITISEDPLGMTSFSLTGRVDNALFMPLFALSAALVTIVGQNGARGNLLRARKAWRRGVMIGWCMTLFTATLIVLLATRIYPIFTDVPQVVDYAVRQTYTLEYSILAIVMNILGIGVFQALGKPLPGLALVFTRIYVITIPLVLLFVKVFHWGIPGIWYGFLVGNILSGILSTIFTEGYFRRILKDHQENPASAAQRTVP